MGNTPSHSQGDASSTPGPSGGTPQASSSPTPGPSSSQPITHPISTTPHAASTFHSGLTPPTKPPSPDPPGTPPLLPYGGHLSPQNPHALTLAQAKDYSKTIVTRLVMEARLAPFYRGLEDYEEDSTKEDIGKLLDEVREKDYEAGVQNSVVEQMKADRDGPSGVGGVVKKIGIHKARDSRALEERDEAYRREKKAYLGALECPICFLSYPPNINTTRCCQQPICTECFVQIRRSEPSLTHLESEPASCPFCVETDFGVIYERPPLPTTTSSTSVVANSALSISPETPAGLSQALTNQVESAELDIGIGMAPKVQETLRRKSVSSKSKEVVTIDEVRPDWEMKLNAVKAAAARRASRKVIMRQVGDRLIPIGYTSARAPGQADFSMSVPSSSQRSGNTSGNTTPSRRERRRAGSRGRDLEEVGRSRSLMIMEAMRLSLLDHEDHQRRQDDEIRRGSTPIHNNDSGIIITTAAPRRTSDGALYPNKQEKSPSTASKILSKFSSSGNRSRSGSSASSLRAVSFSQSNTSLTGTAGPSQRNSLSGVSGLTAPAAKSSPPPPSIPTPIASTQTSSSSAPSVSSPLSPSSNAATLSRSPPKSLSPSTGSPVAPITTLINHTALHSTDTPSTKPVPPPPAPIGLPMPTKITNPMGDSPIIPGVAGTPSPKTEVHQNNLMTSALPNGPLGTQTRGSTAISSSPPRLPRISLDMPSLVPEHTPESRNQSRRASGTSLKTGSQVMEERRPTVDRSETGLSTVQSERNYAALDSDEEE